MPRRSLRWLVLLLVAFVSASHAAAATESGEGVSQTGTVHFVVETSRSFANGMGQPNYTQDLLTLPGLFKISFVRSDAVINFRFFWEEGSGPAVHDMAVDLTDLPGPGRYHLLFTWDSGRGLSQAYFNGRPLRLPGVRFDPWWVPEAAGAPQVGEGLLTVSDLQVSADYTPPAEARALVPADLIGRGTEWIGFPRPPKPLEVAERRGELLYENRFETAGDWDDWVKEGPVKIFEQDGHSVLRSEDFEGHFVVWCPRDFPESFIAEWKFMPLAEEGLAIIFFAAKGENGEDIFDPSLPERDGNFRDYIVGSILSYHVSYYANVTYQKGRTDSNLRKNNRFFRVGGGPVAVEPGAEGWQQMRLIKDGDRIQLFANGRIKVDWTDDDPERYGLPHGAGKIGFRQMAPTVAAYRDFRVWALEPVAQEEDRQSGP